MQPLTCVLNQGNLLVSQTISLVHGCRSISWSVVSTCRFRTVFSCSVFAVARRLLRSAFALPDACGAAPGRFLEVAHLCERKGRIVLDGHLWKVDVAALAHLARCRGTDEAATVQERQ